MNQLFSLANHFMKGLKIIGHKNMLFECDKKHYNTYNENNMRKACFDKLKQVLIKFIK